MAVPFVDDGWMSRSPVIDATWWTTPQQIDWPSTQATTIGAVLVRDPHLGLKCYLGIGHGLDADDDAAWIATMGARVRASVACAMFPIYTDETWCEDDRAITQAP
jgi:hypothetical protein